MNVTRADMVAAGGSPSVRLFEAAACGVPIVSDRWAGLDSFFEPGREVLIVDDDAQVLEILRRTHEDDRRAIGEAGRRRVMSGHTASDRAEELESLIESERNPIPSLGLVIREHV